MLKRNSIKCSRQIWRPSKVRTGWPYGNFLNGLAKSTQLIVQNID